MAQDETEMMGLVSWSGTSQGTWQQAGENFQKIDREFSNRGLNLIWEGADPTGVSDSSQALKNALNAEYDNVFIPKGVYRISQNVIVSAKKKLQFARNSRLKPDSGVKITVDGAVEAHPSDWIMDLSEGGIFSGNIRSGFLFPEWLGAKNDRITDDTLAVQTCINVMANGLGGYVYLLPGAGYGVTKLTIRSNVTLKGSNRRNTSLVALPSTFPGLIMSDYPGPVIKSQIEDVRIDGNNRLNPKQNGLHLDAVPQTIPEFTGGIWYSLFREVDIVNFRGHCIYLRAIDQIGDLANQFLEFENMTLYRDATELSRCLVALGQLEHVTFKNVQFDGKRMNDNTYAPGVNVYLSRSFSAGIPEQDITPYLLNFNNCTFQESVKGVFIDRSENINFNGNWFENLNYGVDINQGAEQILFIGNRFVNACADGQSTGYGIRFNNSSGTVVSNRFAGKVDKAIRGVNHHGLAIYGNSGEVTTSGYSQQMAMDVNGAINTKKHRDILLSGHNTIALRSITSELSVGERITIRAWESSAGKVLRITGGGNISNLPRSLTLRKGQYATFVKSDLGSDISMESTNTAPPRAADLNDDSTIIGYKFFVGDVIDRFPPLPGSSQGWVCIREGIAHYSDASATLTKSSAVIPVNVTWSWNVGDAIAGEGIPANTFVTSLDITNKTLTLSNTVTVSGTNIRIYDARFAPYGMISNV